MRAFLGDDLNLYLLTDILLQNLNLILSNYRSICQITHLFVVCKAVISQRKVN